MLNLTHITSPPPDDNAVIASIRVLLDGHEFVRLGPDDCLSVDFSKELIYSAPSDNDVDGRPFYFFRANGRTFAVVRQYHWSWVQSRGEIIVQLNSGDLISHHVAVGG